MEQYLPSSSSLLVGDDRSPSSLYWIVGTGEGFTKESPIFKDSNGRGSEDDAYLLHRRPAIQSALYVLPSCCSTGVEGTLVEV